MVTILASCTLRITTIVARMNEARNVIQFPIKQINSSQEYAEKERFVSINICAFCYAKTLCTKFACISHTKNANIFQLTHIHCYRKYCDRRRTTKRRIRCECNVNQSVSFVGVLQLTQCTALHKVIHKCSMCPFLGCHGSFR